MRSAAHRTLVATFLAMLTVVFALVPGAARAAKDELVIGMTQFPSTFHPNIDSMLAKTYVLGMAHRPMTAYDADWDLICMLCVELPTLENGGAELETTPEGEQAIAVTYALQPDATWGDGTPVTTEDVEFTWEVGRHPESGVANAELYRRILAIDVHDEKTFTLHLDRVTFDYNALGDFRLLPAHLERDAFREPAKYRNRTLFDTDTTNPGLWFGPYRVSRVETGALVELVPNETWWGEEPYFRRIVVRVIENTAALEANLLSGSIDYVAGELGLSLDQAISLEGRRGEAFEFVYRPGLIYEHIDLNLDNPALSDRRVRQALLLAIDREAISDRLFGGRQPAAHGPVSPLDRAFHEDLPTWDFDPKRARELLERADWQRGSDGVRRNADGDRLEVPLMTTAGNRIRELVQQVIARAWKEVGVEVRSRNEPARVFFGETVSKRRFEGGAMFAWISSPENVPRTTLHSEMIPTEENGWSGQNYTGYANPEMDALIDAIEVELDEDARMELWAELQDIYAEDLPALPLYFRADPFVIPEWLKGIEPTGHQFPTSYWVEHWRAE